MSPHAEPLQINCEKNNHRCHFLAKSAHFCLFHAGKNAPKNCQFSLAIKPFNVLPLNSLEKIV
jgi:hypothetical protein